MKRLMRIMFSLLEILRYQVYQAYLQCSFDRETDGILIMIDNAEYATRQCINEE